METEEEYSMNSESETDSECEFDLLIENQKKEEEKEELKNLEKKDYTLILKIFEDLSVSYNEKFKKIRMIDFISFLYSNKNFEVRWINFRDESDILISNGNPMFLKCIISMESVIGSRFYIKIHTCNFYDCKEDEVEKKSKVNKSNQDYEKKSFYNIYWCDENRCYGFGIFKSNE
jgi:hypothetical protein